MAESPKTTQSDSTDKSTQVWRYFKKKSRDQKPSKSTGTPGNGSLSHGRLLPFSGKNFHYFDSSSYLMGRAFTHQKVKNLLLATYKRLAHSAPKKVWGLMEASNENGGRLFPHRTHQNGLSIDFMSPLLKNEKIYHQLDYMGLNHYWMQFNNAGIYEKDRSVSIDFNHMAQHILMLDNLAPQFGLRIKKVIFKIELKDELFASTYGRKLKQSTLYFARRLDRKTNEAHDEHYHIDFEVIE